MRGFGISFRSGLIVLPFRPTRCEDASGMQKPRLARGASLILWSRAALIAGLHPADADPPVPVHDPTALHVAGPGGGVVGGRVIVGVRCGAGDGAQGQAADQACRNGAAVVAPAIGAIGIITAVVAAAIIGRAIAVARSVKAGPVTVALAVIGRAVASAEPVAGSAVAGAEALAIRDIRGTCDPNAIAIKMIALLRRGGLGLKD